MFSDRPRAQPLFGDQSKPNGRVDRVLDLATRERELGRFEDQPFGCQTPETLHCDDVGFGQRAARRTHQSNGRVSTMGSRHEELD